MIIVIYADEYFSSIALIAYAAMKVKSFTARTAAVKPKKIVAICYRVLKTSAEKVFFMRTNYNLIFDGINIKASIFVTFCWKNGFRA